MDENAKKVYQQVDSLQKELEQIRQIKNKAFMVFEPNFPRKELKDCLHTHWYSLCRWSTLPRICSSTLKLQSFDDIQKIFMAYRVNGVSHQEFCKQLDKSKTNVEKFIASLNDELEHYKHLFEGS